MKAQRVVVGYDGSASARNAVEAAIEAVADDGIVHVVTAHDPSDPHEVTGEIEALPAEFRDTIDALATPTRCLNDAARLLDQARVRHEDHLTEGDPADSILGLADAIGADLIVVGSRGIRHGTRLLRGSVSTRITTHARTSFLVVVHEDE